MLLEIVVFLAVFAVSAMLIFASGSARAEAAKQTIGRLNVAIAPRQPIAPEEAIDVRKREKSRAMPLLNRLLDRLEEDGRISQLLRQSESNWTPSMLVVLTIACWLGGVILVLSRVPVLPLAFILALLPAAAPTAWLQQKRDRRFRKFEEELPAALDLMVSAMRAGHSLVSSIELVGRDSPDPVGKEFRLCFDEQNYGLELRDALDSLATRVPMSDLRIVVTAILVQKETGGNLAEVLNKCAQLMRERFRLKKEIRIKTAQGRLTGWVLSLLPPFLCLLLYLVHPEVVSLLWQRPIGVRLLWIGSCMTIIGGMIIRKIVDIRV